MLYNNPNPFEKHISTCPSCGKIFEQGEMVCAVYHIGTGCCHYGDKEIAATHPPEEEKP